MAAGVPVLGANAGAIPEVLMNGECGLLFDRSDVDECAKAIERSVFASSERTLRTQRALESLWMRYSLRVATDSYLSVLRKL